MSPTQSDQMSADPRRPWLLVGLGLIMGALLVSACKPYDRMTWFMEVLPVFIALPLMCISHRRFPLTTVLYVAIFFHCLVLIMGGAYTYARVPLGFQIADWLGMTRNPYDKIGHFMQGFVPALLVREILIRRHEVRTVAMRFLLTTCVVLAFSAFYELIEWWAALAMGGSADDFLGTQGYVWDTQSDMFWALCAALLAQILFGPLQSAQMRHLTDVVTPVAAPPDDAH
ncbi:DUF2238 domain-containing protein [Limnobacter humi]|uniref:DUF2238 domain-containing protein n=1 Tax=Limnobacter humi TaxID=1778671 RepID=A0ABT1WGI2_9BURK|nr:DUF2238 domain-containing protein [Limnobacter humi]MCQ8896608.1 DUF2238 domain-containing protein [Limnobacter humi]